MKRAITLAGLLILSCVGALGQAPGVGSSNEFTFYFGVNGYEPASRFGEPADVAVDERKGLIYVADVKAGVIDAFSVQGIPKFQYGAKNGIKAPVGLAVDRTGNLYVSENDGGPIKVINAKGEVTTIELPAEPESGKETPKAGRMAFDRDWNLYVVDRANSRILAFDKNRTFLFRFGGFGEKRGEFKLLQDVAVDRQGRIYAADAVAVPIQVFDRRGQYIYGFGSRTQGTDNLSFPAALYVDRNDQVWVVDKNLHAVKVFDRSGGFLRSFGSYGQGEGSLFYPNAIASDGMGRIYVLEFGARRLQAFMVARPFEPFSISGF